MTLHVVGNLCVDTTLRVPRFPVPGETLVADSSATGLGGKGLNQAVAAARAGADAVLHAAIGRADAAAIATALEAETRLKSRLSSLALPTDTSTVLVRPDGENLIVSATACARAFDPLPALEALRLGPGDIVLMQGNLPGDITATCLRAAKARGATTVLNPSPLWDGSPDWPAIDLLVLNAGELADLSRETEPLAGARRLQALGPSTIVVTLGRHGALYVEAAGHFAEEAPRVMAVDTSGAGDVFCGVLVALLHGGSSSRPAVRRAVQAAALSVTRAGALPSCPTAAEMAALLPDPNSRSLS